MELSKPNRDAVKSKIEDVSGNQLIRFKWRATMSGLLFGWAIQDKKAK